MQIVGKTEPTWSEPLWRYFKAGHFISLIESSCLYFAAATQFADPFEGAVAVMPPDFQVDPRYPYLDAGERAFKQLKRLIKINCWHRADYESDAMWKLYAGESKGVAICTTPERIRAAARPFRLAPEYEPEDLFCGVVEYVDLTQVKLNLSMLDHFFLKHKAFSWEKEFRLAISVRIAEENGVKVPELGVSLSVDLDSLIERIVLGPLLEGTEIIAITEAATKAGLASRIEKSTLLGQPRYM
jgi:hypothetical protein